MSNATHNGNGANMTANEIARTMIAARSDLTVAGLKMTAVEVVVCADAGVDPVDVAAIVYDLFRRIVPIRVTSMNWNPCATVGQSK